MQRNTAWLSRLAFAAVCAVGLAATSVGASAAGRELVFWTADDCSWCKAWKDSDRSAEFQAAAASSGLALLTVRKARLDQPPQAFEFPDGLTPSAVDQRPTLLPSFDFLCHGRQVKRLVGVAAWDSFWHQSVRQLARTCP